MSSTPMLDQLKFACNSDRTEHCFRFLFMQDAGQTELFIARLEAECEVVRNRMLKYQRLLQEGRSLSRFDTAADDGLRCTSEGQYKDGLILNALNDLLELAREAREERLGHVSTMEQHG